MSEFEGFILVVYFMFCAGTGFYFASLEAQKEKRNRIMEAIVFAASFIVAPAILAIWLFDHLNSDNE